MDYRQEEPTNKRLIRKRFLLIILILIAVIVTSTYTWAKISGSTEESTAGEVSQADEDRVSSRDRAGSTYRPSPTSGSNNDRPQDNEERSEESSGVETPYTPGVGIPGSHQGFYDDEIGYVGGYGSGTVGSSRSAGYAAPPPSSNNVPSPPAPKPSPAPSPGPAPKPEPAPKPGPAPKPDPVPAPTPKPDPVPVPDPTPKPDPEPAVSRAKLIKHGWDIPNPQFVADNIESMEESPYEGVVVRMDAPSREGRADWMGLSGDIHTQTPVDINDIRDNLAPMAGLESEDLKYNFVIAYTDDVGDLYDDWSIPIENFAKLAQATKEAGLEGIFFDNEEYYPEYNEETEEWERSTLLWPSNCRDRDLYEECIGQAYLRGQQMMEAIVDVWPEVKLLTTVSPIWGVQDALDELYDMDAEVNGGMHAWANLLRGSFAVGMASATIGNDALYIDGGEIYSARTDAHFKKIVEWQKDRLAAESILVPDEIRGQYAENISSSFGIYDDYLEGWHPMNSEIWTPTLVNALNNADHYVWAYTERHDWWGTGSPSTPVDEVWLAATRLALDILDSID